jgi:hypothetical protein
MKDPAVAVQKAAVTAIRAAFNTAGYSNPSDRVLWDPKPGQTMPYLVITGETVIPWPTKDTEGGEVTLSYTGWGTSVESAATLVDYAIQALTNRTSPLTPTGFDTSSYDLEFRGTPIRDEVPTATGNRSYWGIPFRFRIRVVEQ